MGPLHRSAPTSIGRLPAIAIPIAVAGLAGLACLAPVGATASPAPARAQEPSRVDRDLPREPGLTLRLFQLEHAPEFLPALVPNQTPNVDRRVATLALVGDDFDGVTAPHLTRALGWLAIDEPGAYRLLVASDDGARLSLDGEVVVDNDGRHGTISLISRPLDLEPGLHPLLVEHFDSGGARELRLEWQRPGREGFTAVPASALWCETDPTRVTSPGVKAIVDARKPGLGLPVPGVHPAWRVESLPRGGRPDGFEPQVGALAFLPDGRLAFGTFDPLQRDEVSLPDIDSKPPDAIWALDLATNELSKIATDVYEPSGLCVVDGTLYVAHRRAVTRLTDADGDGFMESHETVGSGWEGWNYHQFAFGLVHSDGKLYTALSTAMAPPDWEGMENNAGPNGPLRGTFVEIDLSSGDARAIAGGARTPNGLGFDARGRLLYADNQGAWMPASVLAEVVPGGFYGHYNWTAYVPKLAARFPRGGHPSVFCDRPRRPPALWLPHGEVVNSPTEPLPIPTGPFAGQLLLGELTAGGIRRVFLEEVDGVLQGALFRFTQGLECGVNRMAWGPDGNLYVGGIGAGGNWNWNGTRFGLQRLVPTDRGLVPTDRDVFELHSVEATPSGFRVRFTDAADVAWLGDPSNYLAASWTYEPTQAYGGPKVGARDHRILSATPLFGGRGVELVVDDLEEGTCVHLTLDAPAADGRALWSAETWYTLNRIPPLDGAPAAGREVARLWNGASGPLMRLEGAPGETNLTQAELVASRPWIELAADGPDLVSRVRLAAPRLAVEWRLADGDGPAPRAWLEWGDEELAFDVEKGDGDSDWDGDSDGDGDRDSSASGAWRRTELRASALGPHAAPAPVALRVEGPVGARSLQVRSIAVVDGGEPATDRRPGPWIRRPGPWIDLLADPVGWVPRGGEATYALVDGVLRGESRPDTPNTFWTSARRFGDFELLYEVRVHPELNSGVQIRSEVVGGFENRSGHLRGYQVEIDPSERAWSAGLYEERGRGWLHPLHAAPYARRAWRQGEWNRYRVVCDGPLVRTWLNGVPAAEVYDEGARDGHLGFQVHGVGGREDPLWVEWRNVRLRELR